MAHTQERDTAQSINTLRNGSSAAQFERAERETLLNQYPEASWVIPRGAPNQWRTQERDTAESKTHRNGRKTTLLNQYPEASWVIPRGAPNQWRTQERDTAQSMSARSKQRERDTAQSMSARSKQRERHAVPPNNGAHAGKRHCSINQYPSKRQQRCSIRKSRERDTAQSISRSKLGNPTRCPQTMAHARKRHC
jgi:hypothetical protein